MLDFNDEKNFYELKFRIGIFNERDALGLISKKYESLNFITLNNDCSVKESELICKINKTAFVGNLLGEEDTFKTSFFVKEEGMCYHPLVLDIIIKYKTNKENIYVQIKRMLSGISSNEDYIAYETNVTEISPSVSQYFKLKFSKSGSQTEEIKCLFKKYNDKKPLFLLCSMRNLDSGNYTLNEIKQKMKLENINLKYNYIINPVKNNEIINYNNGLKFGGFILSIRPDILDYTKKDSYKVIFYGGIKEMKGLALEPNLKDLNCDYELGINCTIPKSYFEGQKDGYYYTYHENHLGGKSPCYEMAPIKVILTPESKSSAEKIKIFGLTFALLMVFILF